MTSRARSKTDLRDNLYRPAYVIYNFFRDFGHYFVYDRETLVAALNASSISRRARLCARRKQLIGEAFNRFETMVVEARKP